MRALPKIFLTLLRLQPWIGVVLVILGTISGACTAALLSMVGEALRVGSFDQRGLFGLLALGSIGSFAISQALAYALAADTLYKLRLQMTDQVLEQSPEELERLGGARVLAFLTEDIPRLAAATAAAPDAFTSCIVVLSALGYLAWLSFNAFVICLALVLLVGVVLLPGFGMLAKHSLATRLQLDRLYQLFTQMLDGHTELVLSLRRRRSFRHFGVDSVAKKARQSAMKTAVASSYVSAVTRSSVFVLLFGVLVFGSSRTDVDVTVMTSFALVIMYLIGPLTLIVSFMPRANEGAVALANIRAAGVVVGAKPVLPSALELDAPVPSVEPAMAEPIHLDEVVYQYEGSDQRSFTVGPISASFSPGEITFIVGGNGSGKSTLAKAIAGLYEPASGNISVGRRRVESDDLQWYREHISAIFTDFALFDQNWGRPHDHALGQRLLGELGLSEKVSFKEDGSFSQVKLSTGQRKRLALLDALMNDRPVYVLDEWAADQDPHFKRVFYRSILPALREQGKIVIVVTHDERYFDVADHRLKLEEGMVSTDETRAFMVRLHQQADG